jgi:hypothetical protein
MGKEPIPDIVPSKDKMIGNDPALYNPIPVEKHAPEAIMHEQCGDPRKPMPKVIDERTKKNLERLIETKF